MARKRIQVPKRIAGIPVPRQMRASPIAAFLASPGGQLILAEILLALAAVLVTAANPATKPGRYLRRAIVDGAALLHIVDSAGGSKKSPLRTAMLTVAVERAIAAFSTALSRTIPRKTAAEASGARDVTPPDAGKKKRSTSRRLIRR